MRKILMTLAATAAIATVAVGAAPRPAHAIWWIAPAIIGGAIAGTAIGSAAARHDGPLGGPYAYEPGPAGDIYVRPSDQPASCYWARERVPGGWRRVQVCD